jgi:hypothetical protein
LWVLGRLASVQVCRRLCGDDQAVLVCCHEALRQVVLQLRSVVIVRRSSSHSNRCRGGRGGLQGHSCDRTLQLWPCTRRAVCECAERSSDVGRVTTSCCV